MKLKDLCRGIAAACLLLSINPLYASSEPDGPVARRHIQRVSRQLLYEEKFAELEKLGAEYRNNKAKLPQGLWKLVPFYDGVDHPIKNEDDAWKIHMKKLEQWLKAYPRSTTAHVASGFAWQEFGGYARGGGYANTVSYNSRQIHQQRLEYAAKHLQKPINPKDDCPGRYHALLQLALGQGMEREQFEKLFKEAVQFEPTYLNFYYQKFGYLRPRWYGAPGEWQAFADQAAQLNPPSFGKALYSRLLWSAWDSREISSFDAPGISWPKFKEGFTEMVKQYPDSPFLLNHFCRFACLANDKATAAELFRKIGGHPYLEAWGVSALDKEGGKREFLKWREWAEVGKETPLIIDRNNSEDFHQVRLLAEAGDPISQFWVGNYDDGPKPSPWTRKAAEGGVPMAQMEMATKENDPAVAFQWHLKAADNGNEYSLMRVGFAYMAGLPLPADDEKAYIYLVQVKENNIERKVKELENRLGTEKLDKARLAAKEFEKSLAIKALYLPDPIRPEM